MRLSIPKSIKAIKHYFSPLGRFERAAEVLSNSSGFFDDDDGYEYCRNEARQRKKDGRAVRMIMKLADDVFKQEPQKVLHELSAINGWGNSHVEIGETIEQKRDRLLDVVDDQTAHRIRIATVDGIQYDVTYWGLSRSQKDCSIIDDLKKSSAEMLSSGNDIDAYKGFVCLAEGHYNRDERVAAAVKAVDLIETCCKAGINKKILADDLNDKLQYYVPKCSPEWKKVTSAWDMLEGRKQVHAFKGSALDMA